MQKQKEQKIKTPNPFKKQKEDFSFLPQLPTLFTLEGGNPRTILEVVGKSETDGKKYVKKSIILCEQNLQYAYAERTMMQIINSEYVLKLLHWQEIKVKQMTRSRIGKQVIKQQTQVPKKLVLYLDFCQKGDLKNYLENENPPLSKRVQLFIDILYAMRFLHQKFIIHRDMKLENIFVTQDDKIMIADLGYASQTVSLAQTNVGTFAYQAPQVFLGFQGGYDDKADVWSLGYLGFQLLNKPFGEEQKMGKMIRDPFMPAQVLKKKVMSNGNGSLKDEYLKIFSQNPLLFVPQIPNSLKYLIGDMLTPLPENRVSFKQIYEGKYFPRLRDELMQHEHFGAQKVNQMKNLHALIEQYPKIYSSIEEKRRRLKRHEQLYEYLYQKLYGPLMEYLYPGEVLKPLVGENNNSMNILLFLSMRKMKLIYHEVKNEDIFMLKKKLHDFDKAVSGQFVAVKNSVESYLKSQGQKPVDENQTILAEDYFIKLLKMHAPSINLNVNIV